MKTYSEEKQAEFWKAVVIASVRKGAAVPEAIKTADKALVAFMLGMLAALQRGCSK